MRSSPIQIIPQTELYGYSYNEIEIDGEGLLLQKFLQPGFTIFDVGANIGEWSRYALNIEPNLHIAAFEPVPIIYNQLVKNMSPYSNRLYNLAISDHQGIENFFSAEDINWGASSFFPRAVFESKEKIIQVKVDTLDCFCIANKINKIDFLKIDVEGSEMAVLKGANTLLNDGKISAIQFEYGGTFPEAGILLQDVMKFLTNKNYIIFRIFPQGLIHISHWEQNLENNRYSNYVAIMQHIIPQFSHVNF